jgi:hypothetical protein
VLRRSWSTYCSQLSILHLKVGIQSSLRNIAFRIKEMSVYHFTDYDSYLFVSDTCRFFCVFLISFQSEDMQWDFCCVPSLLGDISSLCLVPLKMLGPKLQSVYLIGHFGSGQECAWTDGWILQHWKYYAKIKQNPTISAFCFCSRLIPFLTGALYCFQSTFWETQNYPQDTDFTPHTFG